MANESGNFNDEMHPFERRLAESWPPRAWCDTHVVVGVSGGADSVAMLWAMVALKERHGGRGQLYVGHLNHGLRGNAAEEDAAWVKSLSERLGLPCEVGKVDIGSIAEEQGDGWEAAARSARYDFLLGVAERVGARFIATAHSADDQVETVLHRILRGTGIDGLAGVARVRALSASVALVRPMLGLRRADVIEYLGALRQDYRSDATNEDTQWTRNRLRGELLPQLRERYNSRVDDALSRLATQAGEAQEVIAELAAAIGRECIDASRMRVKIDCARLTGEPPIIVREVLRSAWRRAGWPEQSMGFAQWHMLAALSIGTDSRMLSLPGNIRARREGETIVLEALSS
jgi:tRNA(Ile)-lysidine synthase